MRLRPIHDEPDPPDLAAMSPRELLEHLLELHDRLAVVTVMRQTLAAMLADRRSVVVTPPVHDVGMGREGVTR